MGKGRPLPLLALWALLCALLVGCGSARHPSTQAVATVTKTVTTTATRYTATGTPPPLGSPAAAALPPCPENPSAKASGKLCKVVVSVPAVVAPKGGSATLPGLAAKVERAYTTTVLEGPQGHETAKGTFVVVAVALTNLTGEEKRFNPSETGQAYLLLRGHLFAPDFQAEAGPDPRSLLVADEEASMAPHQTIKGDLDFDLPTALAGAAVREGVLQVAEFGSETPTPPRAMLLPLHP